MTCCNTLESLIGNLSACGPVTPITQADIPLNNPAWPLLLTRDIVVNGNMIPPGIFGPIGIAINTNNVDLDLNDHTILVIGSGTIVCCNDRKSSHAYIHNGTIAGTGSPADQSSTGIDLLTNNCIVSDMQINNFSAFDGPGIIISELFSNSFIIGYPIKKNKELLWNMQPFSKFFWYRSHLCSYKQYQCSRLCY